VIALYRLDDRLIHGQVVVGWGQPLACRFIVLVDDEVRSSDWEQDLYRMGVPDSVEVVFASVDEAAARFAEWEQDPRVGIVLVGDIDTAVRLARSAPVRSLNIGGVHHRPGRTERLRYVYLSPDEIAKLRALAASGVQVSAQDVPTARQVPLADFA
jgi:PTS system mannose-specific IIB component/fructoselysine and glucoselysine-specific PTS system IIB component